MHMRSVDLPSCVPVYRLRGWHLKLQSCAHQRGRRGRGGDARHEDSLYDLHALPRYARSLGRADDRDLGAWYKYLTSCSLLEWVTVLSIIVCYFKKSTFHEFIKCLYQRYQAVLKIIASRVLRKSV